MEKLKDPKLWKAVGLAVGLYAFVPLGIGAVAPNAAGVWQVEIWPRLYTLLVAAPVALAAIAAGGLFCPQRAPRLSTSLGMIGGLLFLVLWRPFLQLHLAGFSPFTLLLLSIVYVPPLAVACWIGADYWKSPSWARFRRGPGGAILAGALAGGTVSFALSLIDIFALQPRFLTAVAHWSGIAPPPYYPFRHIVLALSGFAGAAVVTAVLSFWKPSGRLGAFAGAGLVVAPWGCALLFASREVFAHTDLHASITQIYSLYQLLSRVVTGAVAGSYAGRWQPEPIVADATE